MADSMKVRMTSGEKAGQLLEVEEAVARAWLASGKAVEPGVTVAADSYVAMASVDSPTEALRDTNTTGPVEFAEMPSVNADGTVTGVEMVEVAEVQETPEKPKRRAVEPVEDEKPETR